MNDNHPPSTGEFVLYGADGCEAAHVDEARVEVDWNAVEELARSCEDKSPRARNIARLLLWVRDNVQVDDQCGRCGGAAL